MIISAQRLRLQSGLLLLAATLTLPGLSYGQRLVFEADTQEGQLLQQIDAEKNAASRFALLERFAKEFPNHEAASWVFIQLQAHELESKNYDRVIALAARILSQDPEEISAAYSALQAAQGKKDIVLMTRWSGQTARMCKRLRSLPMPQDQAERKVLEDKLKYSREVEAFSEYTLYFAALNASDQTSKLRLIDNLEKRNPKSEYLAQLRTSQAQAIRQVDLQEAIRAAEEQFRKGEYNFDLLLTVAQHYMEKRVHPDRVVAYSQKIIDMAQGGVPEGLTTAEWQEKKAYALGWAYWMSGLQLSVAEKFAAADKNLRAALTLVSDKNMLAGAYYHLGYSNYRLANAGDRMRIHDSIKFFNLCISQPSDIQAQAVESLKAIKAEYNLQ